jgi:diguanylate cyclase (GGDEF)-like protein/PAS domain S-box-containing protein
MVYRCKYDANWTIEFVSAGCLEVTGYTPVDLLLNNRISFEQMIHPEDRMWLREATRDALERRAVVDVEYRLVRTDGAVVWVWDRSVGVVDVDGRIVAIEGLVQDITERKRTFQALQDAERRYRSVFENAIEGIFRTSPTGKYLVVNPALAHMYGYDSPDELTQTVRNIGVQVYVDPQRRQEFARVMREQGMVVGFESEVRRRDGTTIWISENARAVEDESGNVQYYEGTAEDVTERKRYQARIEWQANYDTLTGLANRSLLHDRLERAILSATGHHDQIAVVFVDLDRFKLINDTLGHQVGDELLKTMAQRISGCVRESDTVARIGGDEFVLLLGAGPGKESVAHRLELLLAAVAQPWATPQGEFQVTCSIGVALYPEDGSDAATLLKHADTALYQAKDHGRNRFRFFTSELNRLMSERLELENRLRRALERKEFVLHYQSRVDIATQRITGVEALVRWRRSETELVEPMRFIPLAEETGLIIPLGAWVLHAACTQLLEWQRQGLDPGVVSVNVSAQQFAHGDVVRLVREVLEETGLDPAYLELELTESAMMRDAPKLVEMLDDLKSLGVQISIDDFGTGYSSLSYLKRFPVDRLKIDRSFMVDVATSKDDAAIVRSIIALGHALRLRVVAEGVETDAQMHFLETSGCDEVQGFLLGRPVPADEAARLFARVAKSKRG